MKYSARHLIKSLWASIKVVIKKLYQILPTRLQSQPDRCIGKTLFCIVWTYKCFGLENVRTYRRLVSFNAVLISLVARIEITLLLKIQWKQHHILYVRIVYKHKMTRSKFYAQRRRGMGVD
jgi:hypothetical protein